MTHVIAQPCINVKDKACVDVCPVDCIHGNDADPQLYINPDDCIDCTLCVSQCPVGAIYMEGDLPEKWAEWLELNARLSRVWPVITRQKEPLAEHDRWSTVEDKRAELSETPGEGD